MTRFEKRTWSIPFAPYYCFKTVRACIAWVSSECLRFLQNFHNFYYILRKRTWYQYSTETRELSNFQYIVLLTSWKWNHFLEINQILPLLTSLEKLIAEFAFDDKIIFDIFIYWTFVSMSNLYSKHFALEFTAY